MSLTRVHNIKINRSACESEREPRGDEREAADWSKATQAVVVSEDVVVTGSAEHHRSGEKQATDLYA